MDASSTRPPSPTELERHTATARRFRKAIGASLFLVSWGMLVTLYAWLGEPGWIEVTRHTVGAPVAGARPLRIVQIADLHLRQLGGRERRVAAAVREAKPDLLVLGGDLVDRAELLPLLDAFLALVDVRVPAVAVPGNWEYWAGIERHELEPLLARRGVKLLVDESLRLQFDGRPYVVVGLDDASTSRPDPARATGGGPTTGNVLAVAHSPWIRDTWRGPAPTFLLAAHTHGGQVTFLGYAPARPPGSGPYVAGWYRGPPFDAYVNRGIGTSILPIRFGARPEVAVFDWWLR
jgi:predicted MPP superfamily phosphohydrolase